MFAQGHQPTDNLNVAISPPNPGVKQVARAAFAGRCKVCYSEMAHRLGHGFLTSTTCAGSNWPLATSTFPSATSTTPSESGANSQLSVQEDRTSHSVIVFQTPVLDCSTPPFDHPTPPGPLIKHIPMPTRAQLSKLLTDLLGRILTDPDCIARCSDLFNVGRNILSKPHCGSRYHIMSKIILKRVTRLIDPDNDPELSQNVLKPSKSNHNESSASQLTSAVSYKIADGSG